MTPEDYFNEYSLKIGDSVTAMGYEDNGSAIITGFENNGNLVLDRDLIGHKCRLAASCATKIAQEVVKKENEMQNFKDYIKTDKGCELCSTLKVALGRPNLKAETDNTIIMEGFRWEVSCPRIFKWFMCEEVNIPAAIHDYLLDAGYEPAFADQQFYKALRIKGCSFIYSMVLWAAVRTYSINSKIKLI